MVKYNVRLQTTIGTLAGQVGVANQAVATHANVAATNAQAVAQAAKIASNRLRPAAPQVSEQD
jgi:high-affinity K+ transport system ATPase subunit B